MRSKTKATEHPVPQSEDECTSAIRRLGEQRREVRRIEADMNDKLAAIRAESNEEAEPFKQACKNLIAGIESYCAAHRKRLTHGGKIKTALFSAGEVKWRTRPPKVSIRGTEAVLDALRDRGLTRFIRVAESVNKEAILADPSAVAGIKGITVGSEGEDFIVEPSEDEIVTDAA